MKVCTCLNPLHTCLAIYGCILGYESIYKEMADPQLKKQVEVVGYTEGLPVVVDPSHATGRASLVPSMAVAAAASEADGIMVEVHNNPSCALCDGAQSLTPAQFSTLNQKIQRVREAIR